MEEGTYKVFESSRTYFYPTMSVRIEGAVLLYRTKSVLGFKDEVLDSAGHAVTVHPGWSGVTHEGDEAPPSQLKVDDGRIPQDAGIHL